MKKAFLKRLTATILVAGMMISAPAITSEAKAKKTTISAATLQAGEQFVLTEMPDNGKNSMISEFKGKKLKIRAVQNFSYTPDGKYIFTTSECNTGGTLHTLLCRCSIPGSTGPGAEAVCEEAIVLEKYGHGEAIAITQDDLSEEKYNLWVATTKGKEKYGIEIARITAKVEDGTTSILKTVRIGDFKKANVVKGKAAYFDRKPTPRRLNVAIDEKGNQIMFRVQFPTGQGVNYVSYDFKKLNAALNKVGNGKKYSIAKAAKWQKANIRTSLVPANTYQSFQISDNTLYVCGGHMDMGAQIYAIKYKAYANGKSEIQKKYEKKYISRIIDIKTTLNIKGKTFNNSKLEIEGMKLQKKKSGKIDVYVNFYVDGIGMMKDGVSIYKFQI